MGTSLSSPDSITGRSLGCSLELNVIDRGLVSLSNKVESASCVTLNYCEGVIKHAGRRKLIEKLNRYYHLC
jgi:hypothetical protein